MTTVLRADVTDLGFPTSQTLDGSDAMNADPDYSAAYVRLVTDEDEVYGCGLTFTIGRGNDICCAAISALADLVVGQDVEQVCADLSPEQLVDVADLSHLGNALTREEALAILRRGQVGKQERLAELERHGYPCYTTSAGWLGYSDEKLRRLCQEAVDDGYQHVKLKVGLDPVRDRERLTIAPVVSGAAYRLTTAPGYSAEITPAALAEFSYAHGTAWSEAR